jgi:hypothetical protein
VSPPDGDRIRGVLHHVVMFDDAANFSGSGLPGQRRAVLRPLRWVSLGVLLLAMQTPGVESDPDADR